jgi:hypothetical protein
MDEWQPVSGFTEASFGARSRRHGQRRSVAVICVDRRSADRISSVWGSFAEGVATVVMPVGADGRGPRVTPLLAPCPRTTATSRRSYATAHGRMCRPPAGRTRPRCPTSTVEEHGSMAQLTSGWFSLRICRDRRHRVDLSVAPCEHWRQRCFVASSLRQQRADPEGETAQHTPITIWCADTGQGEGMWPTILGPLHKLLRGLSEASIRSLRSDTFIHAQRSGRRALTGVGESSGSRVAALGPCS